MAMPQLGHSVHVEVDSLQPHRWYFYRFHVRDEVSPVGRTRTAPSYDAMPDRLKFAFTSCQHYESGYFNGYPHMQQEDLDLVIHLGDYIYEYAGTDKHPRQHIGQEIKTLDDYRTRYAQYRLDMTLQEAHRLFPWARHMGRSRIRQQLCQLGVRRRRDRAGSVSCATHECVPGLLRIHATAASVVPTRAGHEAVSRLPIRSAGQFPGAGYKAVSYRSTQR